jgi:hypothetical protein
MAGRPGEPSGESIEELERQAQRTRERLGGTIGALSEKADIRGQAKRKAEKLGGRLAGSAGEDRADQALRAASGFQKAATRHPLVFAAGTLVLGMVLGRLTKRNP